MKQTQRLQSHEPETILELLALLISHTHPYAHDIDRNKRLHASKRGTLWTAVILFKTGGGGRQQGRIRAQEARAGGGGNQRRRGALGGGELGLSGKRLGLGAGERADARRGRGARHLVDEGRQRAALKTGGQRPRLLRACRGGAQGCSRERDGS